MKNLAKILFIQLALISMSYCWWDTGHMLVAKIAELSMIEEGN